jgi:transcriptional regulator with XRE-family HTH domain
MGTSKWTDKRFGQRLRTEREGRGWSQAYLAKALSTVGVHTMHPTTIAKIEAGERSLRINEAMGIADLLEVSLDFLVGRHEVDDTTSAFLLRVLTSYAGNAKRQIGQARAVAIAVEDILDDGAERFDSPHIAEMLRLAIDMSEHLEAAETRAQQIDSIADQAVTDAVEQATP